MLQGRLSTAVAAGAVVVLLVSCAGADGTDRGAIRENVIEPGITAIDDSKALACNADAASLRTALEAHRLLEGGPAPDEAALVAGEYVREESELWDVADGAIVPVDPACGAIPVDVAAPEIVTSTEATDVAAGAELSEQLDAMTPSDVLDTLTDADITQVGGRECALEVAAVGLGLSRWQLDNQTNQLTSMSQVVDDGYVGPLELWTLTDTQLVPVDGTDCVGPLDVLEPVG